MSNASRRALLAAAAVSASSSFAQAIDVSAPALLQWFDGSWQTIENRTPDVFRAGYGGVWTPPPGRADLSNSSVGYDVYDRFDLGSAGKPTLYGTETGLKTMVSQFHQAGLRSYVDLVWNHDGFSDWSTAGFKAAGGYPGFLLGQGNGDWGDFHDPGASGDINGQTSDLLDIAQESNNLYVRNPVPGYVNNLPAGTTPAFGRLANVPVDSNRRFYPDQQLGAAVVHDPATGASDVPLYSFNPNSPMLGDPVAENALGYLMRNTRWLVQAIGVDGFRLDATKHMQPWVLNYFDRAVYQAIQPPLLDGTRQQVFSFGEYYGSDMGELQARRRNDINPATPNTVGGNRDDLDFPLYFAMAESLTGNGLQNDWHNVVNSSFDRNDDGLANNGSQGVAFVQAHDTGLPAPYLSNVAYAYTLMRPGNAIVYFNGHEFGNNRSFPADGRGDALGGYYGDAITTLVDIRNRYGRGNYVQRALEKELLIYEREDSALVLVSNRIDNGFDTRTVQTSFPVGTHLVELTGNAASSTIDPLNDLPETVVVQANGSVTVRVPRNKSATGTEHDSGYLIYGPQSPVGTLTIQGAPSTIAGGTPTAGSNGTTRLSSIKVITGDSFGVALATNAVTLPDGYRDTSADGDNALVKLDGGVDVNNSGQVDLRDPGSAVYGFEQFVTQRNPGTGSASGNGSYLQTINAAVLAEGYHYVTVRAFRQRGANEPAIYTDFTQTVYVDRLKPVSSVASFDAAVVGTNETRIAIGKSVDSTANNMHFFIDLPPNLTDAQVRAMVGGASQGAKADRDQWNKTFANVTSGNHVLTIVSYEITGNSSVQRVPGWSVSSILGLGLGDTNFNGTVNSADVATFQNVLFSGGGQFNAAADLNPDGRVDVADLFLLGPRLTHVNADGATQGAYATLIDAPTVKNSTYTVTGHQTVYDVTAGTTVVPAGASLTARSLRSTGVDIAGGVVLTPGSGPSTLTSVARVASLDVADNDVFFTSPTDLRQYLADHSIFSSVADADPDHLLTLGYSDTRLTLTILGDATLDGIIDPDDYALLDRGFAKHRSTWTDGDFNYDGVIDYADYLLIDRTFALTQGLSPALLAAREARFGADYAAALAAGVPEPAPSLAASAALLLLTIRNRTSVSEVTL